jgi:hypothetical protein
MDWRCGSSSRVPALQVQGPEFKLWSYHFPPKKKKEKKIYCTAKTLYGNTVKKY